MYTWIFSTHVFYLKFFYRCYLPDVASGVIVLSCIISLVPSICVVGEDDEPNNVEFVLIDIHDEFTENIALISYDKEYFPMFFLSYIPITCIHIYSSMCKISVNFLTYVHTDILHTCILYNIFS